MIILLFTVVSAKSQVKFEMVNNATSNIEISGNSTLHSWSMKSNKFTGNAQFFLTSDSQIAGLKSLELLLPVDDLTSGVKSMDKKAHSELNADHFKTITYKLIDANVVGKSDLNTRIATKGMLTISGVSSEVSLDLFCIANDDSSIDCNGSYHLKMTDYNVEPPYFLLGLLSVGETVEVNFKLHYEK